MIEHNMRLVAHVVKKYSGTTKEPEDLISIGAIGLIKAVDTYSARKGSRLATYAAKCIDNPILSRMRFYQKKNHKTSKLSKYILHQFRGLYNS